MVLVQRLAMRSPPSSAGAETPMAAKTNRSILPRRLRPKALTMRTRKSGISKVVVACNNCGDGAAQPVACGVDHEYDNTTDDAFSVMRCTTCGLLYLNPRPELSELETIYPKNYYAYVLEEKNRSPESHNSALYKLRKAVYLGRLKRALSLCKSDGTPRVLDIGCGDGRALNWYRELDGQKIETHGVDFNAASIEKAKISGHHVYLGRFEDTVIPLDFFDLVVATHVIEHVADPRGFATRALQILKPGGIFLCETPNAGSLDARLFKGRHWGGYHFPRHWVLYTPQSISYMANAVGFTIRRIDFNPAPAFWNWTGHSVLKSWGMKEIADALFPPVDFQKNNLSNFIRAGIFTSIDLIVKLCSGTTSNMAVFMEKPF
jgi:2-polyprenyl-3-methyl-5-hydroxy-6-metoxy-1,4-benzoquinol methylase